MAGWDNLSEGQRAAVFHETGPAAVYAGPGSGKTRVVTLRAARLAQSGKRTLVTTFTSDATTEMKHRISSMLSPEAMSRTRVTTLHAFCLNLLKVHGIKFSLLTDEFQRKSLAEAAQAGDLEGGVIDFLSKLSFQKNTGITAASYKHDGSSEDMDFARAWRAYEKEKSKKSLLEFDDLILEASSLLEKQPEIRARVSEQFTHIIVDECQDMNSPQYRIVFLLGREHQNLMLVGDLDQSLYSFRGADTQSFKRFAAQPRVQVYELQENYRCTRQILAFADSLIRQDEDRRQIAFVPMRTEGEAVSWQRFDDPDIEALAIGDSILRNHRGGTKWRDMAVLYRTNAQAEAIERNFAALEIPYTIREDGDFYARREVQGILAYLNLFTAPLPGTASHETGLATQYSFPDEWLLAVLNVPNRKIGKVVGSQLKNTADVRGKRIWDIIAEFHADDLKTHRAIRSLMQDVQTIAVKLKDILNAGEAIRAIRVATEFDGWLRKESGKEDKDNDRIQNIQRMQSAAAHYHTIEDYLKAVQRVRDEASRRKSERQKKRREQDEVSFSTGHSAKGLEWKTVYGIGWSETILPHAKAEDINEERRIAYVIATRAKDNLYISSIDSWNDTTTEPSRFLTGLNLTLRLPDPEMRASKHNSESDEDLVDHYGDFDPFDSNKLIDAGDLGGLFMP